MRLFHLDLTNFRTYQNASLDFNTRLVFFIGENGAGKTNILESISILSQTKSFRESNDSRLVQWEKSFFFLRAKFEDFEEEHTIEYGLETKPAVRRKMKFDSKDISTRKDLFGKLHTILLTPLDLVIVEGGPSERRRFLDSFISGFNSNYFRDLLDYNKILKHRNALLKSNPSDKKEFSAWNHRLVQCAERIRSERSEIVDVLKRFYAENLASLSGNRDKYDLIYKPTFDSAEDLLQKLESNLNRELRVGYTTHGIHRDDLFIGTKEGDIAQIGSQGQKRSTVISLKTACLSFYQQILGIQPILLIDDVIRELDVKRREYFVQLVQNAGQSFFTTTDLEGISDYVGSLEEKKQIFYVETGSVNESI